MGGTAHKVLSACLRVVEFGFASIILGILARFFYVLGQLNGPTDSRLIYTLSMAAISVLASIILVFPVRFSFYCAPLDLSLFVCWIVAYALLQELAATDACSSLWYTNYWTIWWDSSGKATVTAKPGCSQWRVVIAFSFMISFIWLFSGILGIYACMEYYDLANHVTRMVRKLTWWKKPKQGDLKPVSENKEAQHLPHIDQAANVTPV